jgi:hypothetical protein
MHSTAVLHSVIFLETLSPSGQQPLMQLIISLQLTLAHLNPKLDGQWTGTTPFLRAQ